MFLMLIFSPSVYSFGSWEAPPMYWKKEEVEREIEKTKKTINYLENLEKKRFVIYKINEKKNI